MKKKFAILFDDDRTRAIPIISEASKFDSVETTKKIEPVEVERTCHCHRKNGKNGHSSLVELLA